jgi:hypothetical protein
MAELPFQEVRLVIYKTTKEYISRSGANEADWCLYGYENEERLVFVWISLDSGEVDFPEFIAFESGKSILLLDVSNPGTDRYKEKWSVPVSWRIYMNNKGTA